jgi:hypothetical protein
VRLLGNARAALDPGGRILVLDAMLGPGDAPDPGKLLDVHMMLLVPAGRSGHRTSSTRCFAPPACVWSACGSCCPVS